jgi:hypothetical protein
MGAQEYKRRRLKLRNEVYNLVNRIDESLIIKGSWFKSDFHYNFYNNTSYSDLDLLSFNNIDNKQKLENRLSVLLKKKLKCNIPVSIHLENALSELTLNEAHDLALLEYTYQIRKENDFLRVNYLKSKFILYLLRIDIKETYEQVKTRLKNEYVDRCYLIKLGYKESINNEYLASIIDDYIYDIKLRERVKIVILENSPSTKHLDNIYHDIMRQTKLGDFLVNRIKEKYRTLKL